MIFSVALKAGLVGDGPLKLVFLRVALFVDTKDGPVLPFIEPIPMIIDMTCSTARGPIIVFHVTLLIDVAVKAVILEEIIHQVSVGNGSQGLGKAILRRIRT